jgi:uncharacterized protein (DUF488 family)
MLYTIGYSGRTLDDLQQILDTHEAVLVDIRFRAASRLPDFRQPTLQGHFGARNRHYPALGNVNYKGGPITLQDYATGLNQVRTLLDQVPAVMLMCVCARVATCHRKVVGEQLQEDLHVSLVHL